MANDSSGQPPPPPTIGKLKSMGLAGVWVSCTRAGCQRSVAPGFDQLGLPDDLLFPEIPARRRFICSGCGAKTVSVTPDWREYRALGGMGKPYP
jgi:hypothetical protein